MPSEPRHLATLDVPLPQMLCSLGALLGFRLLHIRVSGGRKSGAQIPHSLCWRRRITSVKGTAWLHLRSKRTSPTDIDGSLSLAVTAYHPYDIHLAWSPLYSPTLA